MSKVFFNDFGIKEPDYHLGVGSGSHGKQTGEILTKVEAVLMEEKPDVVVVYGDTNTTLGAALAAAKLHIPVAHVEAGLRSFNKAMPEEINRVLTDHCSTILFCPTETAIRNLEQEGFNIADNGKLISSGCDTALRTPLFSPVVVNVGDVMYDVVLIAADMAAPRSKILKTLGLDEKGYAVLTMHRAETTDRPGKLEEIADFVNGVTGGMPVVFPVHPRTRNLLNTIKNGLGEQVKLIEPVGYFDMVWLLKNSRIALTDSGGLQKEAYLLGVPCITLRDETEWVETVESGWNVLYKNYSGSHSLGYRANFYGDGSAATKIIGLLSTIIKY
jgi:UDP-N-acetylglucosamine 2-epimerase